MNGYRDAHRVLNKTILHKYTPILLYRYLPRGKLVTATMLSDLLDYCNQIARLTKELQ